MNKKGSARDVVLIAVILFSIGIGMFMIHSLFNTAVDKMLVTPVINESSAASSALSSAKSLSDRFDYIFFGLFIGLVLALMITSWFIGGNPVFMFVYFIVVIIAVVLGTIMSNVWDSVSTASVFGVTVASFPLTNHILLYLPYYMSVIGILGIIVMFAKPYIADGGV